MSDVIRNLNIFINELDSNTIKGVEKACRIVKNEAQSKVPVDSGQLKQSIKYRTKESGTDVIGEVYTNLEYAPYVHEGTGIYAKKGNGNKKGWAYTVDGKKYFTRGQKPKPFLDEAVQETKSKVLEIIGGEVL